MKTRYVQAKSALNRSGIVKGGWCLNPYGGCTHACRYCYAVFMKKFYRETAPWGEFVIVKENVLGLLDRELERRRPSEVWLSSVTDCYQPIEARLRLTRGCVERLAARGFEVSVLTKSPLVVRDLDVLVPGKARVGITITTDRDEVARLFEERIAPPSKRIEALKALSDAGLETHAFVGPALPMDPARLAKALRGATGRILLDRMNYHDRVVALYRARRWERFLTDAYYKEVADAFTAEFGTAHVECCW